MTLPSDPNEIIRRDYRVGRGPALGAFLPVEKRLANAERLGHRPAARNGRPQESPADRLLRLVAAATIPMDRPRWVWDQRIPVGGTTLMPGREGLGKTAFVGHLAARITRGDLPGEWKGRPGAVIYIGYEDDRATVLVPRLTAAGADLTRFYFVDIPLGGTFVVDIDVDRLRDALTAAGLDVALVIVDPLDSHLGSVDSHRKAEVQAAIQRLAELAQELRCGALGLAHLNKSDTRDLLSRVVGSVGFTSSVRAVLGVGEHPDDQADRVCVLGKANMTDKTTVPAIRFRVEGTQVAHPDGDEPINTARVVILGEETGIDPDSIITGNAEERGALEEAGAWLKSILSDGPVAAAEIKKMAAAEGIAYATLHRCRKRVGVISERDDNAHGRPATWRLPYVSGGSDTKPLDTKPIHRLTSTNSSAEGGFVSTPGVDTKHGCDWVTAATDIDGWGYVTCIRPAGHPGGHKAGEIVHDGGEWAREREDRAATERPSDENRELFR